MDAGEQPGLMDQGGLGVGRVEVAEQLQGDFAFEARLPCAEHRAVVAGADRAANVEPAPPRRWRCGGGGRRRNSLTDARDMREHLQVRDDLPLRRIDGASLSLDPVHLAAVGHGGDQRLEAPALDAARRLPDHAFTWRCERRRCPASAQASLSTARRAAVRAAAAVGLSNIAASSA